MNEHTVTPTQYAVRSRAFSDVHATPEFVAELSEAWGLPEPTIVYLITQRNSMIMQEVMTA